MFSTEALQRTHLFDYHKDVLKGKMVPFAGYEMPVQYPNGIMKEHHHCRSSVGLFDVSHMGQVHVSGKHAEEFLERMTVADLKQLEKGKATLSLLMNENGGINDDCIITRLEDEKFFVVLNAGCKYSDLKHMDVYKNKEFSGKDVNINYFEDNSLIAIQGPKAQKLVEEVLGINLIDMDFMTAIQSTFKKENVPIQISRCGYTGEDGFEISVPEKAIVPFVESLTAVKDGDNQVAEWVGLGARDSLRLEAGLCLYGHELNENISPIEAMLAWTISARRKEAGGYLGDQIVKKHIADGVSKKRCGFISTGIPPREGAELFTKDGKKVGEVTSGAPAPSIKKNIGMAYVEVPHQKFKTELVAKVRGKDVPVTVRKMPFVPSNYYKKP